MSTTIDERVVEMRFDNKQFEAGASETMSTLQKLKKALDFSNVGKSFENIDKAADKVDMAGLAKVISGLRHKFSALEVMAITTLGNITNSIVNSAKRWVSAFTIEPIKTGFQEYETQINAIQTILANTQKEGTNIEQVNAALDELNAYADKTIYNFTEMTRNIGTFTAAGVDLKTSVGAIQGIANLAAVSGSNSQQASTAMYQLSQALSTGTVKLMDWNSVVNAGMGGQLFQDALKETSRLLGTGADAAIEAEGSFRESLKTGWLTSEVLTETLKKFTTSGAAEYISKYTGLSKEAIETELELAKSTYGEAEAIDKAAEALAKKSGKNKKEIAETLRFAQTAEDAATKVKTFTQLIDTLKEAVQSGWSQSFRIIVGDFEEAKKLFTEISDSFGAVISASANARNSLLSEVFDKKDGRELLIDSLRNSLKGLLSIIKPVKEAFREVFPPATANQVYGILEAFHEFTKTLTLSEKNSKNLRKAFKGLFDIAKLVGDGFSSLIKLIIPMKDPLGDLGDGIFTLAGSFGDLLSSFSKGVRSSEKISKAFNGLKKGASSLSSGLSQLVKNGISFVEKLSKMEGTAKLIDAVTNAFEKLYKNAGHYIKNFISDAGELADSLFSFEDIDIDEYLKTISSAFADLASKINNFSFETVEKAFDSFKLKIEEFSNTITSNDGLSTFITNFKEYGEELKEAFTLDNLLDRIEKVMDVFGKFFNWVKTTLGPAFEEFNVGTAVAGAGGIGIVYSLIKMSKAFENISGILGSIPDVLGGVKDTITAYQNDLKASTLIKVAGAIAILAGALVLLSFADTTRLMEASIALSLVAGVLFLGISKLSDVANKGKSLNDTLSIFAKGFSDTMKDFGKSLKIKAIGKVVKSFAESIAIVAVTMIALGIMYKKDKESLLAGVQLVGWIGLAMLAIAGVLTAFSTIGDSKMISSIASSILMMSLSLALIVASISKLMKMELPTNYDKKLKILVGIVGGLAALALLLGVSARIAGNNELPKMASAIKSLAILLVATVLSLKLLFDMGLPTDYDKKLWILGKIFDAFGGLLLIIGVTSRIAGGNGIKAAGSILAIAGFLAVVVGSLFVLTLIPADKMLKGAISLGGILVALGAALYGAGQISDKNAYKAIIAMAVTVGVIVAALAALSMIPWKKLAVSTASLGVVLLALAADFKMLSKINSEQALPAVLGMIAATLAIALSLYVLSKQPWENMLAAAASISLTLLAFGKTFEMIVGKNWSQNNVKKIGTFLLMTLAVIPIGGALAVLANQPWEGTLAAGAALSSTIIAFSKAFEIILGKNWSQNNVKKIGTFLLMTLAVIPIGTAIGLLAFQDWTSLLAASASLSLTLVALTGCFAILSSVKVDLATIGAVVAGSASLILIAAGISMLAQYDGQTLLTSCLALSAILLVMVGVMAACSALSAVIGPAMIGVLGLGAIIAELALVLAAIGGLAQIPGLKWLIDEGGTLLQGVGTAIGQFIGGIIGGAMEGISSQLPQLGLNLSQFMVNLTPFLMGAKLINAETLACVGFLSGIIIALTAAEIVNGIANLFGLSLTDMAVELSEFMVALTPFIMGIKLLNPESMQACYYLAGMILALTAAEIITGIGKILGLGGTLTEFGTELESFGPHIKKFAEDVKDVDADSVEGASKAAEIMANVARKLPGTKGLFQKIFGEKSLAQFGTELESFGPHIKKFAEDVKDVKPEAVEGASKAAEIMANVARKLPAQKGFAQKIFGEKSLAEFGEELVKFGPKLSRFSFQVKGITESSVTGASSAASIMATLANELPSSETLWEKIFGGGEVSLTEFGEELVSFGTSMSNFYNSISGINVWKMNGVITGFSDLVDLTDYIQDISATDLVDFINELGEISVESIDTFVQAFSKAGSRSIQGFADGINSNTPLAISTIKSFCNVIINQLKTSLPQSSSKKIGQSVVQSLITGIVSKKPSTISTIKDLCSDVIDNFKIGLPNNAFEGIGQSIVMAFRNGMPQSAFKEIGANASLGLKYGIEDKIDEITESAVKAARNAVNSAKKELDEHSPSKVMRKVGEYFSIGLANGIIGQIKMISMAGTKAADEAIEPVKKAVDGITSIINSEDFDVDPVIRPVMDLSNVQNGAREISSLMNRTYDLSSAYNRVMDVSSSFNKTSKSRTGTQNEVSKNGEGNKYEFNQYNYSPKALSRSEIYRQTNNQFSEFRRAVKST